MEERLSKKLDVDVRRNSIDQIREILFGEKSAEWERRVNLIMQSIRDLDEKLIEVDKKLDETNVRLNALHEHFRQSGADWQQLHDLVKLLDKDVNLKIDHLMETKADREKISQALIQWTGAMKEYLKG
jgi:uncharacterized coiled-coil DUF342 family protein